MEKSDMAWVAAIEVKAGERNVLCLPSFGISV
ncbi:hypothetical protein R20943_07113 [Paraburkholderia aspalathi]|nr:hypothetical protein R20943_07113 [Paraburkholderia aspalathi]